MNLCDADATRAAGAIVGKLVQGGDAIALIGDLGAGKTTLVIGLVDALGAGVAASPTFSLVNEYPGGRLVVWHVDLYRLERAALAERGEGRQKQVQRTDEVRRQVRQGRGVAIAAEFPVRAERRLQTSGRVRQSP